MPGVQCAGMVRAQHLQLDVEDLPVFGLGVRVVTKEFIRGRLALLQSENHLAGVVALSCVLAVVLGAHGALAQTKDTAAPGQLCTVVQRSAWGWISTCQSAPAW